MTTEITLLRGDITTFAADIIVNAANSSLLGGGGVDGAIHRAGGPAILADVQALRLSKRIEQFPEGEAIATTAGNLPARWVIHTVGPVYSPDDDRSALLTSCYVSSMELADKLGAETIAFPAISAGAYGWPIEDAARIAIAAIRSTNTHLAIATLVLHSAESHAAFEAALAESVSR